MLRMRARDPDGNEGEVPVTGQGVYLPPTELTAESLQGATVGKERASVPAERFDADHVVFMAAIGEQAESWLAPEVPGAWSSTWSAGRVRALCGPASLWNTGNRRQRF